VHWDELVPVHAVSSAYYDIDGFERGGSSLRQLELDEVGEVAGKTLLHMQCHIGLDTLSWARRGARVTGVDFSEPALAFARSLADRCGLDARFVCADVDTWEGDGEYDVVFTSHGTIVWLPDLDRWARLIARSLRPSGTFYFNDGHPFSYCIDERGRLVRNYFERGPERCESDFDYARPEARVTTPSVQFSHTLGDILTALASAGLRIVFVHEHPFADYACLPTMTRGDDGWWRVPGVESVPRMVSIKATR